jgi:membrane fusion protein, multidrug efflux system
MSHRILVASLIIISSVIASCGFTNKDESKNEEIAVKKKPVSTQTLSLDTIARSVEYSSNLLPMEELFIAPASPGRIEKIHVEIGDRVTEGQLLIEMEPTQLNQALLQLNNLERDFERFDSLIQFGGIPKQQYDQVKTQLDVTRENVDFLRRNTRITADFNGVITGKYFENQELFAGAPNTQVGKAAIVVLQQINPIKAVIAVSEKYFPVVKKGMKVKLKSEIYPEITFDGEIFRIHPTINPASKTFNVEVKINNNKELLRPGMFSRIELEFNQEPAIILPANVVLQQLGTNERYVFLRVNGKAQRVQVKIGKRFDDRLEIISDELKQGDEIIISGHNNLLDKDEIEVVK